MHGIEKRKHKRMAIKLDLSCRKVGIPVVRLLAGRTVNIGPGGAYFETVEGDFQPGDLTELRLLVPPTAGLLESGGAISAQGRVVRCENIENSAISVRDCAVQGVALQFCRPPKLCI